MIAINLAAGAPRTLCERCRTHPASAIYTGAALPCIESQSGWCWRCRAAAKLRANRVAARARVAPRGDERYCAAECGRRLRSTSPRALCWGCAIKGHAAPAVTDGTPAEWAARGRA